MAIQRWQDLVFGGTLAVTLDVGPDMVELLLAYKADRNAKSWDGRTALGHALDSRNEKIIQLLEKSGELGPTKP